MNEQQKSYVINELESIMSDVTFGEARWCIESRLQDLRDFIEEFETGEEKKPENAQETIDNGNF